MEKTRTSPNNLDAHASLEDLDACLQALISLAEQGEWESLEDISDSFLTALETVNATNFLAQGASGKIQSSIQHTLSLLQLAAQQCLVRKEQITPLLNALTRNKLQAKP